MAGVLQLFTLAIILPKLVFTTASTTGRDCVQLAIPVAVYSNNSIYNIPRVDSTIDAVDFVWDIDIPSHLRIKRVVAPHPVKATFDISAQLCVPKVKSTANKASTLVIATPGLGYWDVEIHSEEYSFVDAATKAGYSILTYDRLGTGKSDKPDAYEIVQAPLEVEILRGLTELSRSGKLLNVAKYIKGSKKIDFPVPTKIIHVGHSFGSILSVGFAAKYGTLSDAVISTGFAIALPAATGPEPYGWDAFGWEFAKENDCQRFGDRPSGYMVQGTNGAAQQIFFKKGTFDPELLKYAEKIKETVTVTELVSLTSVVGLAAEFRGPIQFFMPEFDYPICKGNCTGYFALPVLNSVFPVAKNVSLYLQPGAGHGLTFHKNATAGYQVIWSYLASHGL